jgi:cytochrome bd-type quinol oxidase subunit 2
VCELTEIARVDDLYCDRVFNHSAIYHFYMKALFPLLTLASVAAIGVSTISVAQGCPFSNSKGVSSTSSNPITQISLSQLNNPSLKVLGISAAGMAAAAGAMGVVFAYTRRQQPTETAAEYQPEVLVEEVFVGEADAERENDAVLVER